ncbi:MAG: hypothetical protein R6V54_12085, partial [Desulfobacteraceae bacterium]
PASTRTSEEFFPCQPKNQELRSSVSSNSLIFLTPGREKILISFGSQVPAGANPLGALTRLFHIKKNHDAVHHLKARPDFLDIGPNFYQSTPW